MNTIRNKRNYAPPIAQLPQADFEGQIWLARGVRIKYEDDNGEPVAQQYLRAYPGEAYLPKNTTIRRNDTVLINVDPSEVGHKRYRIARLLLVFCVKFQGQTLHLAHVQWFTKVRLGSVLV